MNSEELLKYIYFFREKLNRNKLIIFVGAGVSCNVDGMPSWNDLVFKMAEEIGYSRCSVCKARSKDCDKTCKLKSTFSTEEYLKIPQYVYNQNRKKYDRILAENIQHDLNITAPLSDAILNLAPSHIITTNYDKLIENSQNIQRDNYDVIISDKDLLKSEKNKYIIKMHGDISVPDTIVLKEADYLEYSQKHVLIEMFVKSLLSDHTILFLGYSLNDYNIKLIISWINYIRLQNKTLDSSTRFGYIVFDEEKITRVQKKYYSSNNIEVINLRNMPFVEKIPHDLSNDIGKRLYSFLRVIEDTSLEKIFAKEILYDNAVRFMKEFKFIDYANLLKLLPLQQCSMEGTELLIFSRDEFDSLLDYMNTNSSDALYLKQQFANAGVKKLIYRGTSFKGDCEQYLIDSYNSLIDTQEFRFYIENRYNELNNLSDGTTIEEGFTRYFYKHLVTNYSKNIFEWYENIKYDKMQTEQKVRYLFNLSVLDAQKRYCYNGNDVKKYIAGIADIRQRNMFNMYLDIFLGNSQKLLDLKNTLEILKEQYFNEQCCFVGCSSLINLFKIKRIAMEQYWFYFCNTLFWKGFTDIKQILKIYIEAIICTNGRFVECVPDMLGKKTIKERYAIEPIDFDIMTKYIGTKALYDLIKEYKVEQFNVTEEMCTFIISCLANIVQSFTAMRESRQLEEIVQIIINIALIITHTPISDNQKKEVKQLMSKLFMDRCFVEEFFSRSYPDYPSSTNVMCDLLEFLPREYNMFVVKNIISSSQFENNYCRTNVYKLRRIISSFIDNEDSMRVQEELGDLIESIEPSKKLGVIRLLYRYIIDDKNKQKYKEFITTKFDDLEANAIIDFAFADWLDISAKQEERIIANAIKTYEKQIPGIKSYPDPLDTDLEMICILYLAGKIKDLSALKELTHESVFLQFFIDEEEFDYSQVDLSHYMWRNIFQEPRFLKFLVENKEQIVPRIKKRIEQNAATEFERKILYGCLLDENELLKNH